MPTYEYKCDACGHAFENFQTMSSAPIKKCPKCGKLKVKRLIGTGAGLIFKGSGFYITDYRDKSYGEKAKADSGASATSSEAPSSDKPSTDKPATTSGETKSTDSAKTTAAQPAPAPAPLAPKPEPTKASKSAKKK